MSARLAPARLLLSAVAILGLTLLYHDALLTRFLNDDYLFLEDARRRPVAEALTDLGPLGNYYRPLSRQLYFAALAPVASDSPLVFHLVNYVLFLGVLALLVDLLRALLPAAGVFAGALYFATLPLQRVNLTWISCSQDLLALVFVLAAIAAFRRGRDGLAALAYLGALTSKETALPLPAALAAWHLLVPGAAGRPLARRLVPFVVILAGWVALLVGMRVRHPAAAGFLHFDAEHLLAGYVHGVQSLLGLDHPPGLLGALATTAPALAPLAVLAALGLWLPGAGVPAPAAPRRRIAAFAGAWLLAFMLPAGPVAHTWSSYYYGLAGVGAALLLGLALRDLGRVGWPFAVAAALWWHAAGTAPRAFAIADHPWGWTSHLTAYYFQRAAALGDSLSRRLRELEPSPPAHTRFFFAALPSWAGFQMGNGPLVRALYRDPTLGAHFYSQFSETTAAGHPCRFLYWDGRSFAPLYAKARDPWFQVGTDLLLLRRPHGAAHAFRRGLAADEDADEHLYWLGWSELWRGRRAAAEAAWTAWGARDDSVRWLAHLGGARTALLERADTLAARRHLLAAIRSGIGRPEGHAVLGQLLAGEGRKFGLLELQVAVWLKPADWLATRELFLGLAEVRLDEPARLAFAGLVEHHPSWRDDSLVVRARETLATRSAAGARVAEF